MFSEKSDYTPNHYFDQRDAPENHFGVFNHEISIEEIKEPDHDAHVREYRKAIGSITLDETMNKVNSPNYSINHDPFSPGTKMEDETDISDSEEGSVRRLPIAA